MFILKKFTGKGLESNFYLGDSYNIIYKSINPDEFKKLDDSGHTVDFDKCFAVISCNDGKTFLSLFSTQTNFIYTSTGQVFESLD